MKIDNYIDWDLAKEQLLEVHAVVLDGIRICDIALHTESSYAKDQLLAKLISILTLDDEQIRMLSVAYKDQLATIRRMTANLGEGEIHHDPEV